MVSHYVCFSNRSKVLIHFSSRSLVLIFLFFIDDNFQFISNLKFLTKFFYNKIKKKQMLKKIMMKIIIAKNWLWKKTKKKSQVSQEYENYIRDENHSKTFWIKSAVAALKILKKPNPYRFHIIIEWVFQ